MTTVTIHHGTAEVTLPLSPAEEAHATVAERFAIALAEVDRLEAAEPGLPYGTLRERVQAATGLDWAAAHLAIAHRRG